MDAENTVGPPRKDDGADNICPRCFGSGNWPWAQWGGPLRCSACDGAGKISAVASAKILSDPVDRRNPACPPRPGMNWNDKQGLWMDFDWRSPEAKAHFEIRARGLEEIWKKEGL